MRAEAALGSPQKSTIVRLRPLPIPPWLRAGFQVTSAVAPGAAARVARKLFFTPQRLALAPEHAAVLERGNAFQLDVGGDTLVGHAWGKGPAVLLVHGWGGHAGQMTALVDPLVAAGFRPIAVDMPGHGPSGGELSSLVHFEGALARAAALFGPVRAVVAHSFGAASTVFALSRGLEVGGAVFFASPARFDSFWSRFRAGLGVSDGVWLRMMREAETWLNVRFDDISAAKLAPLRTNPLLVFHDPEDREVAYEEGQELVAAWPGAQLETVQHLGHRRILSDPACIAQTVAFIGTCQPL
jgi:pimeloyl-ACP methyl ester carboxylesterase